MEYTFKDQTYTEESLNAMELDALLALRNEVAESIGVTAIAAFKDKETGVKQTLKALEKASSTPADVAALKGEKKAKKVKEPKERKPRGIPKSSEPKEIKRPTKKHFATIMKVGKHDGTGNHGRPERWSNYSDGMTIAEVIEGNGTEPWDVMNWEKHGIMKITMPTDAEYVERRAAWFKAKGRIDPEVEKAKAKAKAEAQNAGSED